MVVTPLSSAAEPGASVATLVSGVLEPTAPPKVVVPAVLTASVKAPSTVLPKVMLPPPVEVSVVAAPRTTASL